MNEGFGMGGVDGLLEVLDTRAFPSIWYWLLLAGLWAWLGRGALGIPTDLVRAVRRLDPEARPAHPESLLLLDWVSLSAPRWRVERRDGTFMTAIAAFVATLLAALGFGYGSQTAQALFFLLVPLGLLAVLRLSLAHRLALILADAEAGRTEANAAAAAVARAISRHLTVTQLISMLTVGAAAVWGTLWLAMHPNGL